MRGALGRRYKKILMNRRDDQSGVDCLNDFAIAGLVIGSYYLHDAIKNARTAEKKNYR
jgi:hypothetical protein